MNRKGTAYSLARQEQVDRGRLHIVRQLGQDKRILESRGKERSIPLVAI